jgi:hypothetical protein
LAYDFENEGYISETQVDVKTDPLVSGMVLSCISKMNSFFGIKAEMVFNYADVWLQYPE